MSSSPLFENSSVVVTERAGVVTVSPQGTLLHETGGLALGVAVGLGLLTRRCAFDLRRRVMRRGGAAVPFSELTRLQVVPAPFLGGWTFRLVVDVRGRELRLASDFRKEPMLQLLAVLERRLHALPP